MCIGELELTIHNYTLKKIENNPYMAFTISEFIQRVNTFKALKPPYNKMNLSFQIYATYYNQMSQAFEPFIEPWSMEIKIEQKKPSSI